MILDSIENVFKSDSPDISARESFLSDLLSGMYVASDLSYWLRASLEPNKIYSETEHLYIEYCTDTTKMIKKLKENIGLHQAQEKSEEDLELERQTKKTLFKQRKERQKTTAKQTTPA